jgi:hypothetical protein
MSLMTSYVETGRFNLQVLQEDNNFKYLFNLNFLYIYVV